MHSNTALGPTQAFITPDSWSSAGSACTESPKDAFICMLGAVGPQLALIWRSPATCSLLCNCLRFWPPTTYRIQLISFRSERTLPDVGLSGVFDCDRAAVPLVAGDRKRWDQFSTPLNNDDQHAGDRCPIVRSKVVCRCRVCVCVLPWHVDMKLNPWFGCWSSNDLNATEVQILCPCVSSSVRGADIGVWQLGQTWDLPSTVTPKNITPVPRRCYPW